MFIPHNQASPHRLIGKQFLLSRDVSNMVGTFKKGTVLKCESLNMAGTKVMAVNLIDDYDHKVLLNVVDFKEVCKEIK